MVATVGAKLAPHCVCKQEKAERDKKIGSVCLSKRNFEALLVDLLLVKRYRVEVYQNTGAKGNAWSLVTKASPGNLAQVEDVLFGGNTQMSEAKGVMAVSVKFDGKQQTVGIAYGDAVLQELTVVEFDDDEHFSNLCTVLVHLGPQECLISSPDAKKFAEVKGIVERSGILLTECKPADFVSKDIVQDLGRLLAPSSVPQGQAAMLRKSAEVIRIVALLDARSAGAVVECVGIWAAKPKCE
ncbi:hypothetical protein HPB47_022393 [Ixodes persulcatus]|uniref:Uncharacterized protein n=1 Tax=Ixodes persulcatus TaxID=34615 RepID=A0AC60Q9Z7_IXOPE|nr:hypothetical protein HPB47_022393 [Ixodes persulcatus]